MTDKYLLEFNSMGYICVFKDLNNRKKYIFKKIKNNVDYFISIDLEKLKVEKFALSSKKLYSQEVSYKELSFFKSILDNYLYNLNNTFQ